jgi:hypothetical protein
MRDVHKQSPGDTDDPVSRFDGMADRDARLADFLSDPRETREVELKRWLDFDDEFTPGKIARHLMALANQGGGWLQFGFAEQPDGSFLHEGIACPDPSKYSTDAINQIVARHAAPRFHCETHWVECEEGCPGPHALVRVPGGRRVPIVCCKGGPGPKSDPRRGATYDRLPGPQSAPLSEADDWHELLDRCLRARRDELVASVQSAISLLGRAELLDALDGQDQGPASKQTVLASLEAWITESEARLAERLHEPGEDPDLYAAGSWSFSYALDPAPNPPLPLTELRRALEEVVGRETGWPAWWWPHIGDGRCPYPVDGAIECWMRGGNLSDPAHADFWRASGAGLLYLLRGYDEDSAAERSQAHAFLQAGTMLDPAIVVWRVGECLLHAERMARRLGAEEVVAEIRWCGLQGREMGTLEPSRRIHSSGPCQVDRLSSSLNVEAELIGATLPELVRRMTEPIFTGFDFFEMPLAEIERELDRMRGRSDG